jgi:hypothetical protein
MTSLDCFLQAKKSGVTRSPVGLKHTDEDVKTDRNCPVSGTWWGGFLIAIWLALIVEARPRHSCLALNGQGLGMYRGDRGKTAHLDLINRVDMKSHRPPIAGAALPQALITPKCALATGLSEG